jgi:hypothetical protein
MFSDKNYGLPKDLIEAAKRVHEKQLMEYNEDGYIKNPPEGMNKGTEKTREYAAKLGLKGPHLEGEGKLPKKQKLPPLPVRKPKNEEVQFTEEELAEAFAIFLEENFHVDMLTEEDLDYVFENEFPQWLEENRTWDQWRRGLTNDQAAVENEFKGRKRIASSSPGEDALIKAQIKREKTYPIIGGLDDGNIVSSAARNRQPPSTPTPVPPSTPSTPSTSSAPTTINTINNINI